MDHFGAWETLYTGPIVNISRRDRATDRFRAQQRPTEVQTPVGALHSRLQTAETLSQMLQIEARIRDYASDERWIIRSKRRLRRFFLSLRRRPARLERAG